MVGKKSKFAEHERELQAKKGKKNSSIRRITEEEKGSITNDTSSNPTRKRNALLQVSDESLLIGYVEPESDPQLPGEEEIPENPEEMAQSEGSHRLSKPRYGDSAGGDKANITEVENSKTGGRKVDPSITLLTGSSIRTDSELLWDEIQNGVKGKNSGIPMGFNRLNKYLGLRKSIYTTIGAAAGCGKTSLVDCAYVLNPYDWYVKNKHKATTNVKFECIYFSMERKKTYKLAKWLCMKIFKEEDKLITTDELLSWQSTLSKDKQDMAKFYIDNYFKEMTESGVITIIDGQQNPTGIYKFMKAHALKRGKMDEISEFEHRYTPNDDNLITNVVHDHAGKTKNENIGGKYDKKLSIDKASEYYCWARDFLGYSPIMINQFNRTSYQDIQYSKREGGDPDPTVEYWKDSGNVIEDCDVAISLFNPYKYSLDEYMGYTINDFTDENGNNKFRGLKIIKNSYGTDNLRIGLGFLGEVSLFKELAKASQISQKELNSIITNDYFLDYM